MLLLPSLVWMHLEPNPFGSVQSLDLPWAFRGALGTAASTGSVGDAAGTQGRALAGLLAVTGWE